MDGYGRHLALSLVELLVVLAILGVMTVVAAIAVGRGSAHREAAALARALTSARWLAVTSGAPSALVAQGNTLYRIVDSPPRCDSPAVGAPVWEPSRPLTLAWPGAGLTFGPHGRPQRCDGSAVGNATITLSGRDGSRAAVIVASLGRVRWERR